jgi:hypothetical protein
MDLVKIELEKLSRGHVRSINGIVVMRVADRFVFGETINIRASGVDINTAAAGIHEFARSRALA